MPNLAKEITPSANYDLKALRCQFQQAGNNEVVNGLEIIDVVGNGAFGLVYKAKVLDSEKIVALKKVAQDSRYKNRELDILRLLSAHPHSNVIQLYRSFYTQSNEKVFLNLVLEFVPETVSSQMKFYERNFSSTIPDTLIQKYMLDAFSALIHLDSLNICHRDIKPQNLLIDPQTNMLKLADFGSAKLIKSDETNISYICSRFYRAPELVFGATIYSTAVDVWGLGCVFAEMLVGCPLFPGRNQLGLLLEMIKVLGTPSQEDINAMKPQASPINLPKVKHTPIDSIIFARINVEKSSSEVVKFRQLAVNLLKKILVFDPWRRISAKEAVKDAFFVNTLQTLA